MMIILLLIIINQKSYEHFNSSITIINLVLYSNNNEYNEMYKLTREYYKKFNNVKTIAAEFHCIHGQCQHGPNGFKDSFRNFRDNFLVKFPSFKAYTPTTQNERPGESIDITDRIFNEWYIDNYFIEMMIYINNF